jgi:ComF family protein
LCGACLQLPPPWDFALAALVYEFPVDHIVRKFKYRRSLACACILGQEMLNAIPHKDIPLPQALIPVPLHRTRQFRRLFNQSEVLARQLSKSLDIPLYPAGLTRNRRTLAQSGLEASARKKNLRKAFSGVDPGVSHVAIVDDVMTTGTTMAECARTLRATGVKIISAWVAARAIT